MDESCVNMQITKHLTDTAMRRLITMIAERDAAILERNSAIAEKVAAREERNTALLQRDSAYANWETAIEERDAALAALGRATRDRSLLEKKSIGKDFRFLDTLEIEADWSPLRRIQSEPVYTPWMSSVAIAETEQLKNGSVRDVSQVGLPRKRKVAMRPSLDRSIRNKRCGRPAQERIQEVGSVEEVGAHFPKSEAKIVFENLRYPIPHCSCTGAKQQCYRWGNGGWQSSCCTTMISMYPLPMNPAKRGSRLAGRKMSAGAYQKLLVKLASDGVNVNFSVDLKDHWAKHGTNRYVTLR